MGTVSAFNTNIHSAKEKKIDTAKLFISKKHTFSHFLRIHCPLHSYFLLIYVCGHKKLFYSTIRTQTVKQQQG